MRRRKARNAEIDQFAADLRLNASVLRDAFLRDGHVALDFQAADNRRLQPFRRAVHFVEHAVNAIAHPKSLRERFQVNVRSARPEGFDHQ